MRVYKLSFRTPGIFLDDQFISRKGTLAFEVKKPNGDWESVESAGIQVIPESKFKADSVVRELQTEAIAVPTRDAGTLTYYMLLGDTEELDYRIKAKNCPDCWDFYKDTGRDTEEWILDGSRRGWIVVGKGKIPKATS